MRLDAANDQRKMPTQRITVKISAGIATRTKAGKTEFLNDHEKRWNQNPQLSQTSAKMVANTNQRSTTVE